MESSRDQAPAAPAHPQTPAGGEEESRQPLLSPSKQLGHLHHLQKVTVRFKASAKRKVTLSLFPEESREKTSFRHFLSLEK